MPRARRRPTMLQDRVGRRPRHRALGTAGSCLSAHSVMPSVSAGSRQPVAHEVEVVPGRADLARHAALQLACTPSMTGGKYGMMSPPIVVVDLLHLVADLGALGLVDGRKRFLVELVRLRVVPVRSRG